MGAQPLATHIMDSPLWHQRSARELNMSQLFVIRSDPPLNIFLVNYKRLFNIHQYYCHGEIWPGTFFNSDNALAIIFWKLSLSDVLLSQ
jgi:hypothetical protein